MLNNAFFQYVSQPSRADRTYFKVMFFLISMPMIVQGGNTSVQDKVISDLAKLQSFELTSQEIAARPVGDFSSIGTDAACDFDSTVSTIQDAIDTGVAEIRIASNGTYFDNLLIDDQSIVIRGGFVDCVAANSNQSTSEFAVIDGSLVTTSVIRITGMVQRRVVRLENLALIGGSTLAGGEGGGLSLDVADLELQMLRVAVLGNSAGRGGGMNIDNGVGGVQGDIDVFARDVAIDSNTAITRAGGIYCVGLADVTFTGMSAVSNNTADRAAGIHMRNGCEISFYSELFPDSLTLFSGIMDNISENGAGGALITLGAELYLLGQKMCDGEQCLGSNNQSIVVANNHADDDGDGNGDGGGLYLEDSGFTSEVYANGLLMVANSAGGNGGGAYVGANATLNIERQSGGCWSENRCNFILANRSGSSAGLGGAFFVDGGSLELSQSYLEQNRADFGTVISASGETAFVTLEGVIMEDNGDDGSGDFSDFNVIRADLGATVFMRHSTVVDNNVQNSVFDVGVALDSSMVLLNSIIHDPNSGNVFGPVSGPLTISCLMAHEDSSFSGNQVVVDDPEFIDRLGGDYHLNPISPAID
ncbi:hypothetical protein MNBD_GAMMA02-191, partial [hydrothermal vent metagenome]